MDRSNSKKTRRSLQVGMTRLPPQHQRIPSRKWMTSYRKSKKQQQAAVAAAAVVVILPMVQANDPRVTQREMTRGRRRGLGLRMMTIDSDCDCVRRRVRTMRDHA